MCGRGVDPWQVKERHHHDYGMSDMVEVAYICFYSSDLTISSFPLFERHIVFKYHPNKHNL